MKEIIRNILHTKIYIYTIILGVFLLNTGPIIFKTFIIPTFKDEMITNILDESKRVSSHLSNSIDFNNLKTEEINKIMHKELDEFQIEKIHYFAKDGTVIYSTENSKIGTVNENDYYHNIVAKGELFYKIVSKGHKTAEDETITTDVIEIYVPNMKDNKFVSAFELYYDISSEITSFEKISTIMMTLIISANIFGCLFLIIVFYIVSKNNLQIKKYQKDLKDLAERDPLTGIYNRRSFFEISSHMDSLKNRNKESMSIAMIDIDNFKKINDTYGHQSGDGVIQLLAGTLINLTRKSDVVARYGGEEFIILFPEANINGAEIVTNKICKEVEKLILDVDIKFTVSIGISEFKSEQNIDEVISEADKALYRAKETGKNRVVKFEK